MRIATLTAIALALVLPLLSIAAHAEDALEYHLTAKNQIFSPAELKVPAGQKIKLVIKNEDATPAEFESFALNREKIVPSHKEITVMVGPLKAGSYEFDNDFRNSVKGKIIAE